MITKCFIFKAKKHSRQLFKEIKYLIINLTFVIHYKIDAAV